MIQFPIQSFIFSIIDNKADNENIKNDLNKKPAKLHILKNL